MGVPPCAESQHRSRHPRCPRERGCRPAEAPERDEQAEIVLSMMPTAPSGADMPTSSRPTTMAKALLTDNVLRFHLCLKPA